MLCFRLAGPFFRLSMLFHTCHKDMVISLTGVDVLAKFEETESSPAPLTMTLAKPAEEEACSSRDPFARSQMQVTKELMNSCVMLHTS
jgi:hypothetical protein